MLLRDRKAIVANLANLVGYLLLVLVGAILLAHSFFPDAYSFPPLIEPGTFLWDLMLVNAALFANRIAMRAFCTYQLYGVQQALLSFPRMIWGNFINFLATGRAIKLYIGYLKTGRFIKWDKTAHKYPSQESLGSLAPRLGDLLIDRQHISKEQLETALHAQKSSPFRLGEILQQMGVLPPEVLESVLSEQV
jgi:adsorption protein B